MTRNRRWWKQERNDVMRWARKQLVQAAGSHRVWVRKDATLWAHQSLAFDVRCPRSFRSALKVAIEQRRSEDAGQECAF